MNYFAEVRLDQLENSMEIEGPDGNKGIFIPYKNNPLSIRGKYVKLMVLIKERKPNPDNISHYIVPYIRKSERKSYFERMGSLRFIGNMLPLFKRTQKKKVDPDDIMNILGK